MKMAAIYRIAFACHMWVGNIMRPVPVYTFATKKPNSCMSIRLDCKSYVTFMKCFTAKSGLNSINYLKTISLPQKIGKLIELTTIERAL